MPAVFVISVVLVVVAFVTLLLGVLGAGDEPLQFVYVSIASCLLAAVFLTAGVLRGRPSRKPLAASTPDGGPVSWSGASPWTAPEAGSPQAAVPPQAGQTHVQVLSARDATAPPKATGPAGAAASHPDDEGEDPEAARFAAVLGAAGLSGAKVERLRGRFVTVEAVRAASVAELAEVPGISADLARRVHERLRDRAL